MGWYVNNGLMIIIIRSTVYEYHIGKTKYITRFYELEFNTDYIIYNICTHTIKKVYLWIGCGPFEC